jgi:uncharacterized protein (DUF302 family)
MDMKYGFGVAVDGAFDEVLKRTTAALQDEGFGVLSDIDIQAKLREKLDVKMPRYRILGACNPPLAHKALQVEADIGLLLPCNVVVREDEAGAVQVSFIDPDTMMDMIDKPAVRDVATDARARLERVRDKLARPA